LFFDRETKIRWKVGRSSKKEADMEEKKATVFFLGAEV